MTLRRRAKSERPLLICRSPGSRCGISRLCLPRNYRTTARPGVERTNPTTCIRCQASGGSFPLRRRLMRTVLGLTGYTFSPPTRNTVFYEQKVKNTMLIHDKPVLGMTRSNLRALKRLKFPTNLMRRVHSLNPRTRSDNSESATPLLLIVFLIRDGFRPVIRPLPFVTFFDQLTRHPLLCLAVRNVFQLGAGLFVMSRVVMMAWPGDDTSRSPPTTLKGLSWNLPLYILSRSSNLSEWHALV